eukprot:2098450-Pyramimonas_sp.AAC.1
MSGSPVGNDVEMISSDRAPGLEPPRALGALANPGGLEVRELREEPGDLTAARFSEKLRAVRRRAVGARSRVVQGREHNAVSR